MTAYNNYSDTDLIGFLVEGNRSAFEEIYKRYAAALFHYANSRTRSREDSEEMVQELYIWLWTKRQTLSHVTALKPYLYNAIRYKVVNYFEHVAVQQRYIENYVLFETSHDNSNEELSDISDIGPIIEKSIAVLPERCQMAFRLSRIEHLPISNIAERMNISSRTVENYITHALKHLRLTWRNLYSTE